MGRFYRTCEDGLCVYRSCDIFPCEQSDRCTGDGMCRHLECVGGWCSSVANEGDVAGLPDLCSDHGECGGCSGFEVLCSIVFSWSIRYGLQ